MILLGFITSDIITSLTSHYVMHGIDITYETLASINPVLSEDTFFSWNLIWQVVTVGFSLYSHIMQK